VEVNNKSQNSHSGNSNYPKIKAGRPSQIKSSSPEERKNRGTQSKGVSDFKSKLPENIKKTIDKSTTPEKERHKVFIRY
jgi:hypothetical protein